MDGPADAGCIGLWPCSSVAQVSSNASVVGHITDPTGAVITGATIKLQNTGTGATRTTTTNDSGDFSIPDVPAATYALTVSKEGFKTASVPALELLVGKTADASLSTSVGTNTETVEVTTQAQQLQTSEATVGQVIDSRQVNELPLNGRNVLQLATLSAGVSPAQPASTSNPMLYGTRNLYITVEAGRGSSTNYVMDGVYVRNLRFNSLSIQPSVDTIQEFNLLRSTFSTEYGQGQAVVSMVTKSGTNLIHGTAFEFTRSSIFDARNYFARYSSLPHKPVYHRNQFGGTLGGPIVHHKVFFFVGYEGLRSSQAQTFLGFFPTPAQLANTPSQFAMVMKASFPVPNCTTCGANNYIVVRNFADDFDQYMIRSDQVLSAKHSMFERYINFDGRQIQPAVQTATSYPLKGQNVSLGDSYTITPRLINEVRLGYNRSFGFINPINPVPGKNWIAEAGLQNITGGTYPFEYGRPGITITRFTGLGEGGNSQSDWENIYSAGGTVSYVFGNHTVRTGFQFQYRQITQLADTATRGTFTFSGSTDINPATGKPYTALENFARGLCASCAAANGISLGHYKDNTYAAFINDVWQVNQKLTANLGLRYEYPAPFVEKDGLEASLDPRTGKISFHKVPANIPAVLLPYVNTTPNVFPAGIMKPMEKGFAPRVGLSYQATNKTVVRAGLVFTTTT